MLSNEMAHDFHIKCYRKLTAAKLNRDDTFQPDFFDAEFQAYRQIVLGAEVEQVYFKYYEESES
jgi:hypothetical protein